MKNSFKRFRIAGIVVFLILTGIVVRILFPPHYNLSDDLAAGNFSAGELFHEFTGDPAGAYIRYANQVVILEGSVTATGDGYIMLGRDMSLVKCVFRKSIYDRKPDLKPGDPVTLKGVCRGVNMTELVVTHCIVINKPNN